MSESRYALGIDLGGQSVRIALVDETGTIHRRRREPVDAEMTPPTMVDLIHQCVAEVIEQAAGDGKRAVGACVVMPGYMDRDRTRLIFAANLPRLNESPFLADLKAALPLPVTFDADCNAAAWAEYQHGAGRGAKRLIVAAVGTGIGGGVILGGSILRLREHIGGSLGHVIVDPHGPKCACGARGCIETLAAGRALERRAAEAANADPTGRLAQLRSKAGRLSGVEIAEALAERDPAAIEVVEQCGWWLGVGIAAWAPIYAPDRVLIAGGVAAFGDALLDAARRGLDEVGQPRLVQQLTVAAAELGTDAGLVGAAALVLHPPRSI